MNLSTLPDDVLAHIFHHSTATDALRARGVCKRFDHLIRTRGKKRIEVDEFSVEMRVFEKRSAPIGRISFNKGKQMRKRVVVAMRKRSRSKQLVDECGVEEECSDWSASLSQVLVSGRLAFDGMTIDSHFIRAFRKRDLSAVRSVHFTLCEILVSEEELLSFLSCCPLLESLCLELSSVLPSTLTDNVLMSLPLLTSFSFHARGISRLPLLTDALLTHWADGRMQRISIREAVTAWTVDGITRLYKCACSSPRWFDLGRVLPSAAHCVSLLELVSLQGVRVGVEDERAARLFHLLSPSTTCRFALILPHSPA